MENTDQIKVECEQLIDICSNIKYYRDMYKDISAEEYKSDEYVWMLKLSDYVGDVQLLRKKAALQLELNKAKKNIS